MKRKLPAVVLICYGLLMFWLLLGQRMGQQNEAILQLQPMRTVSRFLWVLQHSDQPGLRMHAWVNLLGNVAMFVPLGALVPWIWEKMGSFWRHFLLMAALIIAVEWLQLVSGLGTCDVDDLILNLLGTTAGYLLWYLPKMVYGRKRTENE